MNDKKRLTFGKKGDGSLNGWFIRLRRKVFAEVTTQLTTTLMAQPAPGVLCRPYNSGFHSSHGGRAEDLPQLSTASLARMAA